MSKKINYNSQSETELTKVVAGKREELRALRFAVAGSKNKDVKAARNLRKDIARALTALNLPKATN